jgi:hypothetical protein
MSVCALEYQSLSKILGPSAVAAARRQHAGYTWIYSQILASPGWFPASCNGMASGCPGSPRSPALLRRSMAGQPRLTSGIAEPGYPRHCGLQAQNHPAAVRAELTNIDLAPATPRSTQASNAVTTHERNQSTAGHHTTS